MAKILILGAGMVGSTMAIDLARDGQHDITVADRSESALDDITSRVRSLTGSSMTTQPTDCSDTNAIKKLAGAADVVLGALPSILGFNALRAVIESGTPYSDISFMPENALELDALAKKHNVAAVVDCGVAPGLSNLLAVHSANEMDECESIEIYVGGLPRERHWPFEYKAGFAPYDVIEEYTRPARLVEHGRTIIREALTEREQLEFAGDFFPGVGTLEAFNTDGLRSLIDTLDVPFMKEKTMRYLGHAELMAAFRATGLFSHDEIEVAGQRVRPIDVISTLMFPKWSYEEGEADITVMRIIVRGQCDRQSCEIVWELFDTFDAASGCSSMSRTTAFPPTLVARELLAGQISGVGVLPPELLVGESGLVERILEGMKLRDVQVRKIEHSGELS